MPNMDEVVRQSMEKMEYAKSRGITYMTVQVADIRLLIEEREQLRDQFTSAVRELTKEIEKSQRLDFEYAEERAAHNSLATELIAAEYKVAEQDKEREQFIRDDADTKSIIDGCFKHAIEQDKEIRTMIDFLKEIRRTTEYTLENDGDNLFALKSSLTVAWQRSWNALPEKERSNL